MTRPSPLKAACAAAGLTIRDVAAKVDCTAPVMYQVSTGRVEPWPKLRKDLADVFGYDPFAAATDTTLTDLALGGCERGCSMNRSTRNLTAERAAQGLPATVKDREALQRVAVMVAAATCRKAS